MAVAKIKTEVLVLDPTIPGNAPANSIFLDSLNGESLSTKTSGDVNTPVGSSTSQDRMVKVMQNLSGAAIPANRPVAKKIDGSIVAADSDAAEGQRFIGVTLETISNNSTGQVQLVGPNLPGAVVGLGYVPGQDVFISETGGGFTNNPNSFTGNNDSIIKVGIADCSGGTASGIATDLIMFCEVLVRP